MGMSNFDPINALIEQCRACAEHLQAHFAATDTTARTHMLVRALDSTRIIATQYVEHFSPGHGRDGNPAGADRGGSSARAPAAAPAIDAQAIFAARREQARARANRTPAPDPAAPFATAPATADPASVFARRREQAQASRRTNEPQEVA